MPVANEWRKVAVPYYDEIAVCGAPPSIRRRTFYRHEKGVRPSMARKIFRRTRGNRQGPITRLMSLSDLGQLLKHSLSGPLRSARRGTSRFRFPSRMQSRPRRPHRGASAPPFSQGSRDQAGPWLEERAARRSTRGFAVRDHLACCAFLCRHLPTFVAPKRQEKGQRSEGVSQRGVWGVSIIFNEKLREWENYYNYHRPHGALDGQTPYERRSPR